MTEFRATDCSGTTFGSAIFELTSHLRSLLSRSLNVQSVGAATVELGPADNRQVNPPERMAVADLVTIVGFAGW